MTKHLVVQFASFGPYHFTRFRSAQEALQPRGWKVSGLQTAGTDATYPWDETGLDSGGITTALPNKTFGSIPAAEMRKGIIEALDRLRPNAVAIAGWGTPDARAALSWCRKNGARAIVMSETRASDGARRWWREWLKARLIRRFDGALVGGKAHKEYLVQLGMPAEHIRTGYDVVDNQHFARESAKWKTKGQPEVGDRRSEAGDRSPRRPTGEGAARPKVAVESEEWRVAREEGEREPYFLVSSRFIERKNLHRLIDAYADYRESFQCPVVSVQPEADQESPWDLVLLGTGDGREELERYVKEMGIEGVVFPGFQQIDTLPKWYASAGAFVHPALEEPWGLVINEAMASGLPVICSRTTGAAELIEDGLNGFLFDPRDTRSLSLLLQRMAGLPPAQLALMGENSSRLIDEKAPYSAFGQGLADLLS